MIYEKASDFSLKDFSDRKMQSSSKFGSTNNFGSTSQILLDNTIKNRLNFQPQKLTSIKTE